MANSYTRPCRSCGRRMSMRQMPHGQWVAFENNEAHDCSQPPMVEVIRPTPQRKTRQIEAPAEFDDIVIPDQQAPQPQPVLRRLAELQSSRPILPTPPAAAPSRNLGLSGVRPHPTTTRQNAAPNRPRADPTTPQVIGPFPHYQKPAGSLSWLSGGIKAFAVAYIMLGVLHSIAFSLFVSRATCATTTQSLVYIFCNTGMGISHFVTVVGWPWYWL